MNKLKKWQYILGGVLLLFVLTNPSRSSFASFRHQSGLGGVGRDFNGIIFSVYSKNIYGQPSEKYIGVLGNFIKI